MPDTLFSPDDLQRQVLISQLASRPSIDPSSTIPTPAGTPQLGSQSQAQPNEGGEAKWPYAALLGGQGADAISTMMALKNPNLHEANPMGTAGVMASKVGISALMSYLMHKSASSGHPTQAKVLGVLGGLAGAIPAGMNMRTISNQK